MCKYISVLVYIQYKYRFKGIFSSLKWVVTKEKIVIQKKPEETFLSSY